MRMICPLFFGVMRIAFLLSVFPVTSETFILNQITGLLTRRHQVDVFAHDCNTADLRHPDVEQYRLLEHTTYLGLPSGRAGRLFKALRTLVKGTLQGRFRLWLAVNPWRFGREALSLSLPGRAAAFLDRPAYDAIHCHFGPAGIFGQTLRDVGALRGPLLTTFHGYDISTFVKENGPNVYRNLFRAGDLFTCSSEFIREKLVAAGCNPAKIEKFRLGTDLARFKFKERTMHPGDVVRLITVARLTEKKGLEYSIRAVGKLAERFPRLEYNIVGEGYLRPELTSLVQTLRLQGIVHLLGWKTQDQIQDHFDRSHVFVLASVEGKNGDVEGQGMVLQEAQAMGLPVICTRHNGFPDSILDGRSGFLVPERDADALAKRLADVISHPEAWPEMGRQGRAFVEAEYDLETRNDALVELYRRVRERCTTGPQVSFQPSKQADPNQPLKP